MRLPVTIIFLISLMLLYSSCETKAKIKFQFTIPSVDTAARATRVSLRDLCKSYKTLQGQQVETEGIVWFQFENVSICPTRDALFDDEKKCFWLDFHKDLSLNDSVMQLASGKPFVIRGTIDTSRRGHLGMYLATIRDIYFMQQK